MLERLKEETFQSTPSQSPRLNPVASAAREAGLVSDRLSSELLRVGWTRPAK